MRQAQWRCFLPAVGQHCRQHRRAVGGKRDTLPVTPIRQIDVFLDPRSMEGAKRKGVNRKNIGAEGGKLLAKLGCRFGGSCLSRRLSGKPQADPHRLARRDGALYRRHELIEAGADIPPTLAGVDVGAIAEMRPTGNLLQLHGGSINVALLEPVNSLDDEAIVHLVHFDALADARQQRDCQFAAQVFAEIGKPAQQREPPCVIARAQFVVPQPKAEPLQESTTRSSSPLASRPHSAE